MSLLRWRGITSMINNRRLALPALILTVALLVPFPRAATAQDAAEILEGHSHFGEAFDDGPRQAAYLMGGTGNVDFPVTTKSPLAQKFIHQGVGQMYGFWYVEAERSFRQAAALDPDCAMAYWGMAMSTLKVKRRSDGFAEEALKRKGHVTKREAMYIDALNAPDGIDKVIAAYPNDVEAKAIRIVQLAPFPESKFDRLKQLFDEVFRANPMHPMHHLRLHVYAGLGKYEQVLDSAALCGKTAPAIAHMWHMAGTHCYAPLKRFADAAWHSEAAMRVDHARMIRDRLFPGAVRLYMHNSQHLMLHLAQVGRVRDAIKHAKNLIEMPRHPDFNLLAEIDMEERQKESDTVEVNYGPTGGSAIYGRRRLFELLREFEMWNELIELADSPYLPPTDAIVEQSVRQRYLGLAYLHTGQLQKGKEQIALLEQLRDEQFEAKPRAVDEAIEQAKKTGRSPRVAQEFAERPIDLRIRTAEIGIQELKTTQNLVAGHFLTTRVSKILGGIIAGVGLVVIWLFLKRGRKWLASASVIVSLILAGGVVYLNRSLTSLEGADSGIHPAWLSQIYAEAGDCESAERVAWKLVEKREKEVRPLANLVDVLWQCNKRDEAKAAFEQLRALSAAIDLDVPTFARLAPIAAELGYPADWRVARVVNDVGDRPDLDSLGPFRWTPSPAPDWTLKDADGKEVRFSDYRGKPLVMIFHLGSGCLHCAEQLRTFAEMSPDFAAAGISLVTISTDDAEGLKESQRMLAGKPLPFPILSDPNLEVFKAYRAFDDFENLTLHGTFFIDADGLIRWQDIKYEPFQDAQFVLREAQRLLKFNGRGGT